VEGNHLTNKFDLIFSSKQLINQYQSLNNIYLNLTNTTTKATPTNKKPYDGEFGGIKKKRVFYFFYFFHFQFFGSTNMVIFQIFKLRARVASRKTKFRPLGVHAGAH